MSNKVKPGWREGYSKPNMPLSMPKHFGRGKQRYTQASQERGSQVPADRQDKMKNGEPVGKLDGSSNRV